MTVSVSAQAWRNGSQCPECGVLPDHVGSDVRVEQPRDLARDDAVGVRTGPRLEVPVVPRPDRRHGQLGIVGDGLEPLPGEPGEERREVDRGVDAVEVHVGDPGVDVPRAPAHLVEAGRLEAVFRHRPADDRVEADVGELGAVVDPGLAAAVELDDARGPVDQMGGDPARERVGRFDHVVIGGDHQMASGCPLGLREKGDRATFAGRRGGEAQVVGEIVEAAHGDRSPCFAVDGRAVNANGTGGRRRRRSRPSRSCRRSSGAGCRGPRGTRGGSPSGSRGRRGGRAARRA